MLDGSSFTLSMWFYYDKSHDYQDRSHLFGEVSNASYGKDGWICSVTNSNEIRVMYRYNNEKHLNFYSDSVLLNGWNHLVFTYNKKSNNEVQLYINNKIAGKDNVSCEATRHDEELFIGMGIKEYGGTPTYRCFYEKIDEIGVWNCVLSKDEISTLYSNY